MSSTEGLRGSFAKIRKEWSELDPKIKYLDIFAIFNVLLFGVALIYTSLTDVLLTTTNAAFMIFPAIVAGYIFVLRSNLEDTNIDNRDARKEFFILMSVILSIIVLTIVYAIFLDQVAP